MLNSDYLCLSRSQAQSLLSAPKTEFSFEDHFVLLVRGGFLQDAESLLLSRFSSISTGFEFLLWLRISQGAYQLVDKLTASLSQRSDLQNPWLWFCRQLNLMQLERMEEVRDLGLPPKADLHSWHHLNLAIAGLWLGDQQLSERAIQNLPNEFQPPERYEMAARYQMMSGCSDVALQTLQPLLEHSDLTANGWELAIHLLESTGNNHAAMTMLQRVSVLFPDHSRLLGRRVVASVLQRQPIVARRLSLKDRLLSPASRPIKDKRRCDANLCFAYENGGRADLLRHLHRDLAHHNNDAFEQGNHALQMASLCDPTSFAELQKASSLLRRVSDFKYKNKSFSSGNTFRVGFVSPDFKYHPVGRFYAMLLAAGFGEACDLHTISLVEGDATTPLIMDLATQCGFWHDIHSDSDEIKLNKLRDLKLDVVIDLAGWTSGSIPSLFASRIAPVQVNYLGFFASSGLPEMDYWLGDTSLFPDPMNELHSESIWRLNRCFLAWQPFDNLPEGRICVPAAPNSVDIVFGSFNHARKLSEPTLRLWGRILKAIPGSRLALKAYTSDDPGTTKLLERRMRRCGLDPDQVMWLPTPNATNDHLLQYGLLDVALDPFPNGGCTTTCEALWMGVPVITLAGSRYVSRMSTAVLSGAELTEWIASTEQDYFEKAMRAADQLSHLRQSRQQLRHHLQMSPLGDAKSLAESLSATFVQMNQRSLCSS